MLTLPGGLPGGARCWAFASLAQFRLPPTVMIEVPAAVYQAGQLARITDFLADGSNDLTQYMLAVDRNNPRVADLYKELHPAVIQALREVSKAGHVEGKAVGICGELAGTAIGTILLVGILVTSAQLAPCYRSEQ